MVQRSKGRKLLEQSTSKFSSKFLVIDVTGGSINEDKMANKSKRELFSLLAEKTKKILTADDF